MIAGLALRVDRSWDGQPARADEVVEITLRREPDGAIRIELEAPLHGDAPPSGPPGPTDRLWEHEVVELFLLGDDGRYTEVEIGPHGHHLVLQLHGRRNEVARGLPLELAVTNEGARWRATARLAGGLVPQGELRGNAYALHGAGEGRRYLAWTPVPGEAPDFHRLDRFPVLGLERDQSSGLSPERASSNNRAARRTKP